jgi:superoxide dismutase, Cu-Zn family
MSMRHSLRIALAAGLLALSGCASVTTGVGTAADTSHAVQVSATFGSGAGTAVTYDPNLVPVGAQGTVDAVSGSTGTSVTLTVRGLLPGRSYGAHAHTEPCGVTGAAAGPHYQNTVDPVQPSVDPQYANPDNEIWLDLTTDGDGTGTAHAAASWDFGAQRRAHSVIIHAMPTATDAGKAGTAGNRAACIGVDF